MHILLRTALRNVAVALGLALPVLLVTGALIAWLGPPSWTLAGGEIRASLVGFIGGFAFWYLVLFLPTLTVAAGHQLVLALLPPRWSARGARIVILITSLAIGLAVVGRILAVATEARAAGLIVTVMVPSAVYGLVARPLRPTRQSPSPTG